MINRHGNSKDEGVSVKEASTMRTKYIKKKSSRILDGGVTTLHNHLMYYQITRREGPKLENT